MTNNLDNVGVSAGDRALSRTYLREFGVGMVLYVVFLAAMVLWGDLDGDSPWRFAWALLPVAPALWVAAAVFRHIRRIDDYQRQIALQGLGMGFALSMVASVTLGFLSIAGLDIPGMAWIIYGIGMLGWLVATWIATRR